MGGEIDGFKFPRPLSPLLHLFLLIHLWEMESFSLCWVYNVIRDRMRNELRQTGGLGHGADGRPGAGKRPGLLPAGRHGSLHLPGKMNGPASITCSKSPAQGERSICSVMKPTSLELRSFMDPKEVVHCGHCPRDLRICIMQRFSTGGLQEFFKTCNFYLLIQGHSPLFPSTVKVKKKK